MAAHRAFIALGIASLLAPMHAGAQRGGMITAPRPESRPLVGFGRINDGRMGRDSRDGHGGFDRRAHFSRFQSGFGTFFYGSTLIDPMPQPATVVVPYAVPSYYPVRVYPRPMRYRAEPPAPATPPDPAKSKTVIVGEGHDGGAGVMRIEQLGDSALRLTWRGSVRPIREATFFLADSLRWPLQTQTVDEKSPSAVFKIAKAERAIAFTGLTVIYANGATVTNLVPFAPAHRAVPR